METIHRNGKWTMRFGIWNIKGLISKKENKLENAEFLSAIENMDIFMLSETWLYPDDQLSLPGYTIWNSARQELHKNAKRSSGGLALFIRNELVDMVTIVKEYEDKYTWISFSNTVENNNIEWFIAFVYIIPENSSRESGYELIFARLENDIIEIKKQKSRSKNSNSG